jgi:type II secretory pathway pseudopilin PulG
MEILILVAVVIVALLGAAAVTFGADSRDGNTKNLNAS